VAKAGRNDPCPCGSGKKHKKCCLAKREAAVQSPRPGRAPGRRPGKKAARAKATPRPDGVTEDIVRHIRLIMRLCGEPSATRDDAIALIEDVRKNPPQGTIEEQLARVAACSSDEPKDIVPPPEAADSDRGGDCRGEDQAQ
jgi:hypothetical protein